MSVKNFFTAFFNSISDVKTRFDFDSELRMKLFSDQHFNAFKGKNEFQAIVLEIDDTNNTTTSTDKAGGFVLCKVRPIDIHDFILPEPCAKINGSRPTRSQIKERIDLHPTAISDFIGGQYTFAVGDIVRCYFKEQGPQFDGKMRKLRFKVDTVTHSTGNHNFECLESSAVTIGTSPAASFQNTVANIMNTNVTAPTQVPKTTDSVSPVIPVTSIVDTGQSPTGFDYFSSFSSSTVSAIVQQQKQKQDSDAQDKYVLIFGDSQMESSGYGQRFLQKQFSPYVHRKGIRGTGPKPWLNNTWLNQMTTGIMGPSIGLVLISLGGNDHRRATELAQRLRNNLPAAKIIWIGAEPMAKNGTTYKDVSTRNPKRKKRSMELESMVSPHVDVYINPYTVIGDTYECSDKTKKAGHCDGVHLKGIHAKEFLQAAGLLLE